MTANTPKLKAIGYLRVSTDKQGINGLGIEAQRMAVENFVKQRGARLLKTYLEVESGRNNDRPELNKAIVHARASGGTLVIAKLDRLSRNLLFLLKLQESGVKFIATDIPDANELTVHILAAVAQAERTFISQRTKAAMQAAKLRGAKFGCPNGARALLRAGKGNSAGLKVIKEKADKCAENLRPFIESLRAQGVTSLGAIAEALNKEEMETPRGGLWWKGSVRRLLSRLDTQCTLTQTAIKRG